MLTFRTFVLWVHLAAVAAWVGGLLAVSLVCAPVLMKEATSPKEVARLLGMVIHRFQRVSWEIISVILLTGVFNIIVVGTAREFRFSATYLGMLGAKVILFAAIAAIQAWQSYRLLPAFAAFASGAPSITVPTPPEVRRFQQRLAVTSLLNFVLAASSILLGLELRYR